jgi:hypothetical protein
VGDLAQQRTTLVPNAEAARSPRSKTGRSFANRDYFDRAQMPEPLGLMHLLTG